MITVAIIVNAVFIGFVVVGIVGMLGYGVYLDHSARRGSEVVPTPWREPPDPQPKFDPKLAAPPVGAAHR